RASGGRLGWRASGMPVLELTTIGRKSGEPRTAMLTSPLQVGDMYIVVASRGGDDTHPAWFLNLRDNPEVQVVISGRPSESRRAHIATPEERATLWPQITARHPNYGAYQKRTSREIPLVLLEPV
ncbi:MAG: nitroreductase family deazaflavin-dependent oxidoreductase, partial [Salinibacterium sp.]